MAKTRKKYYFKPNKNTLIVFAFILLLIFLISQIAACSKYDKSLRGAEYVSEMATLPVLKVREMKSADGTVTASYTEIYPPDKNEKVIYLTFDDGPSTKITPQVLNVLKQNNVHATFFMLAQNAEKNPSLTRRVAEEGHVIASHSYSHRYDSLYVDKESFRNEILKAKKVLTEIVGDDRYTDIFRFPGGAFRNERAEFKEVLVEEKIPYVNWNCLTGDSESKSLESKDLLERAKKTAKDSGSNSLIMLMHDTGTKQATVDILPELIKYFKSEGYTFKTLNRY